MSASRLPETSQRPDWPRLVAGRVNGHDLRIASLEAERRVVSSVASSYTETAASGVKVVTVTASGQTITLPTAVGNTAQLTFKLMVAGTLTLDGNGSETIDGGATAALSTQYQAVTIVSDGANWLTI